MLVKVGLIGYGLAGRVFHAPLLSVDPRFRLAAIAAGSRAEQAQADWPQAKLYGTAEELIADPELDLIVIASPNGTHAPLAIAALTAGRHVVVDKPFVTNVRDGATVMALAKKHQRMLSVFHNRRWDGDFLTIKQLLQRQRLGTLYYFESRFDRFRPEAKQRWKEQAEHGGGALLDLGAHLIDQALHLFGWPKDLKADIASQRPNSAGDDYFDLTLIYDKLRVRLASLAVAPTPGPRFILHGDKASFIKYGFDPQEGQLAAGWRPGRAIGWGEEARSQFGQLTDAGEIATLPGSYQHYYGGIADTLTAGGAPPVTLQDGLAVIQLIEWAQKVATLTLPA
jgi:scyllo-inositol 2-dehydrogenase (NADP+)